MSEVPTGQKCFSGFCNPADFRTSYHDISFLRFPLTDLCVSLLEPVEAPPFINCHQQTIGSNNPIFIGKSIADAPNPTVHTQWKLEGFSVRSFSVDMKAHV